MKTDHPLELTDYRGSVVSLDCLACARERGEITLGDIVRSEYFDAHQDFGIPIPGFIIVSSRRHFQSIDECSDAEQADLVRLLIRVRRAMRETLGIGTVYLFQAEDTRHRHFHLWMIPRYSWMDERFGTRVESLRPIIEYSKEHLRTKEHLAEVEAATTALRNAFSSDRVATDTCSGHETAK